MKYLLVLLILHLIQIEIYARKTCYCEDTITSGHIGYTYYVGNGQGCCSGLAQDVGWVTTWATDNKGNEVIVDDEVLSSGMIQTTCCTES